MKKRILLILLVLTFVLIVVASCTDNSNDEFNNGTPNQDAIPFPDLNGGTTDPNGTGEGETTVPKGFEIQEQDDQPGFGDLTPPDN